MSRRGLVSWVVILIALLIGAAVIGIAALIPPWWNRKLGFILGVLPIVTSLIAIRNPGLAWKFDLVAAPLVLFLGLSFPLLIVPIKVVVIIAVFGGLAGPGIFWFIADRKQWPVLWSERSLLLKPLHVTVLVFAFLCFAIVIPILFSFSIPWWPPIGDCGQRSLIGEDGAPRAIDFTAHVVFVPRPPFAIRYFDSSLWALARVEDRFFDTQTTLPEFVIVRAIFRPIDKSEQYFIEGRRSPNLLIRALPVVESVWCGHTAPVDTAQVALRILSRRSAKSEARIVGAVYRAPIGIRTSPVPAVSLLIQGPQVNTKVITDAQGVFDAELPPGDYTIQLVTDKPLQKQAYHLTAGQVEEAKFYVRMGVH